jgi:hypothetical protein
MTRRYNRKTFFEGFRERLDSTIEQEQVDGLEFLLGKFESDPQWSDVRHVAYALATVFHETAGSFQPVEEGYYLGSKARVQKFQKTLKYYPYFGRGYVQLTHKANYAKAGKEFGIDLVNAPELALDPNTAFKCLGGMFKGWYGGKLGTYINDQKTDYVNARRCVNVMDKAGLIAGYARSFEKILKSSAAVSTTGDAADSTSGAAANTIPPGGHTGTNEQPPTIEVNSPEPYQGVGFWSVIKRDFAVATGGNLTFQGVSEYAQQATGWPEWLVAILVKVAVVALIVTVGWFIFRVVHFVVDTWKKNQKVKTEVAAANVQHESFTIKWV